MTGLIQLLLLSARGRLVQWLRLLRSPKYAIGAVIGVGWVGFWILFGLSGSNVRFYGFIDNIQSAGMVFQFAFGVLLGLWVLSSWLLPFGKLGLQFKQADLHLLLPAPVSRRNLIQYALLKAQGPILLTAAIFSIFLGSGTVASYAQSFISIWIIFTFMEWVTRLRGLVLTHFRSLPLRKAAMMRGVVFVVVAAITTVILIRIVSFGSELFAKVVEVGRAQGGFEDFAPLAEVAIDDALRIGLTPFMWIVAPTFSASFNEFVFNCARAMALIGVLHELIVRSKVRFEEPALEHADQLKRTEEGTPGKKKVGWTRQSAVFPLAARGEPSVGVVWKNLMLATRTPCWGVLGVGFAFAAIIGIGLPLLNTPPWVYSIPASVSMILFFLCPIIGGLSFRNDLRHDLPFFEVTRTWPISARRYVWSAVASVSLSSLALSFIAGMVMMGSVTAAMVVDRMGQQSAEINLVPDSLAGGTAAGQLIWVALILASAFPVAAGMTVLLATFHNFAALSFPAWVQLGQAKSKGMAATGQHMIVGWAIFLMLAVATLPSALLVGLVVLVHWWLDLGIGWWSFPIAGVLACIPYFVLAAMVVEWCARLWRELDPSEEMMSPG